MIKNTLDIYKDKNINKYYYNVLNSPTGSGKTVTFLLSIILADLFNCPLNNNYSPNSIVFSNNNLIA